MMKKVLSFLLILASLIYLFITVISNNNIYLTKFDAAKYEKKYYQSQWSIPNSKTPISDEELYSYAGYRYINGLNPILLNPEAPPLGKYLIGLSIILFKNQNIIPLIVNLASLLIIFLIVLIATSSTFSGSLAVFLTVINTLFIDQLIHPSQLEGFQLFFLLLFLLFFWLHQQKRKYLFLIMSSITLGCFITTKAFVLHFLLINLMLLFFYWQKKASLITKSIELFVTNLVALATFILIYIQYFINSGTFRGFLGTQKWIFMFYRQSGIQTTKILGSYLSLTFLNQWRFWSEGYPFIKYESWSILWPIIFILGIYSLIKLIKIKDNKLTNLKLILGSFVLSYNLFLFSIPIFPRYLLLLFIPLNILISIYFTKM